MSNSATKCLVIGQVLNPFPNMITFWICFSLSWEHNNLPDCFVALIATLQIDHDGRRLLIKNNKPEISFGESMHILLQNMSASGAIVNGPLIAAHRPNTQFWPKIDAQQWWSQMQHQKMLFHYILMQAHGKRRCSIHLLKLIL